MNISGYTRKFNRFIQKLLLSIIMAALINLLLILMIFTFFPGLRNYVKEMIMISVYNRIRPTLHFANSASALKKLSKTTSQFELVPDKANAFGCTLRNVVLVTRSYIPYNHSCLMTYHLALSMYRFEKETIQPLARKYFQQPIVKINHVGTYNCRSVRGASRLLSEHAYANAIDITSFQLQDGTLISVKQHWKNAGSKSAFLHDVAQQACKRFRKTLTPNYNALHHDHFHLDQGLRKTCGY